MSRKKPIQGLSAPPIPKCLAVLLCCFASTANAYNFVPTELEYLSSTRICQHALGALNNNQKLNLSFIPSGGRSPWANLIWEVGGWHYCGGAIKLERAKIAPTEEQRISMLEDVISNANYSFSRIDKAHPWANDMSITLARAYHELGDTANAMKLLESQLKLHPTSRKLMSAIALINYDSGRYSKALEWYEKANDAGNGRSPDIIYFMGLTYFKLGQFEDAKAMASRAYSMGYPMTGLKDMLIKKGKW